MLGGGGGGWGGRENKEEFSLVPSFLVLLVRQY